MSLVIKKLGRKKAHREHTMRNLATSLVLYEKVDTTIAKAKVTKSVVDRWISIGKQGTLASRRSLLSEVFDKNAVKKIFEVLIKRYEDQSSGFVRMVKLGERIGDGSTVARLELVNKEVIPDEVTEKPAKSSIKADKKVTVKKSTKPVKSGTKDEEK